MDPYYFLNMSFKFNDGSDLTSYINNILVMYHEGSWKINLIDIGYIKYNQIEYIMIYYDNENKILKCWIDEDNYDKYQIKLILM